MRSRFAYRFAGGLFALVFVVLAAAGCGPDTTTPEDAGADAARSCPFEFLGDPDLEPEMQIVALGAGEVSSPVEDGDAVALIFPPQGGRVLFAGVHATNVSPCNVKLTGVLRDPQSGKIGIDARTVNLRPLGSGWGGSTDSDISTFSNIPVCPNQWSSTDAFGSEYELEVSLKDRDARAVKKMVRVIPICAEPENEAQCLCICKEGYVLGEECAAKTPSSP